MKINCAINISRPAYGDYRKRINITLIDKASGIEFFDGEIELEAFTEAITGLAQRPIEATVRGLDKVGKRRVTEAREIICPLDTYKRTELENWLKENAQEEGWILSAYLGSQTSIQKNEKGETVLRYSVSKYVQQ